MSHNTVMVWRNTVLTVFLAAVAANVTPRGAAVADVADVPMGTYRAVLSLPGGELTADGSLAGDFWSGMAYHAKLAASRDANASLSDAYSLTTMRGGSKAFDFAFPDLTGSMVSSKDPQFHGKVMIVALAGSWCPNCLFAVQRFEKRRLVMVEATQRFRQHYGIEYTTLIAGISDKDEAGKKLPMLDRVYAFPTTIFIDKKGMVRKIHTGFSGPATGEHYTQFAAQVKATLDELLAET